MKITITLFIIFFSFLTTASAQIISTGNMPSQIYKRSAIPAGPSVYGVFAGMTPCQEFLREVNLGVSSACTKRKMGLTLYQDPITHQPTTYETWGMGKWTGKGNWHILNGTSHNSNEIVFQLDLDPNTFLFLFKGDANVLYILDRNKKFLIGNADHSYTMNRVRN